MGGKRDSLRYALGRARLSGSKKTITNHKREAARFVETLREIGFGVEKWTNISNHHVAKVVEHWQAEGLKAATIKNYVAGVRAVCRAYGNDRIHEDNTAFNIERRAYVTNRDKSVSWEGYQQVRTRLEDSGDEAKERVGLMLGYEREFGMRAEEATKFNPFRDTEYGQVHIHVGTKGGRPRWVPILSERQEDLLAQARESGFYASPRATIIPEDLREEQWRDYVYRAVREEGLTKENLGTMHGLRHAYAQERYEELTGFLPPVKFASKGAYEAQAVSAAGDDWRERDELARCAIREELGHSPGRDDIDSQYLGRWA